MNIADLKKVVNPDYTIIYKKENDNTITHMPLNMCKSENENIIAIQIREKDYYGHCYTEILDYFYYIDLTEEEKKKCYIHEENYDGYHFGSNRRKVDVPDNLKQLGFTNGLRDYYENDSSD